MLSDILHEIAYGLMIEYGPVVELHILSKSEFEAAKSAGDPFIYNVVNEGRSYA